MPNQTAKVNNRTWRQRFLNDPELLERMVEEGRFADEEAADRWRSWMKLTDPEFEAALDGLWEPKRETEPRFWHDRRFNHPSQPVVGICWYEAQAYCAWLSALIGVPFRLPTEVESEAASRGLSGRSYAHGPEIDPLAANTFETHLKRPSPIGVFPNGRTPEGVDDLCGNVYEWTSSAFGAGVIGESDTDYPYPYDAEDGREDPDAAPNVRRVVRGGAWMNSQPNSPAVVRNFDPPDSRVAHYGMRLAASIT
jgi:formylglycine-generating enzyme required for sulfatase activity